MDHIGSFIEFWLMLLLQTQKSYRAHYKFCRHILDGYLSAYKLINKHHSLIFVKLFLYRFIYEASKYHSANFTKLRWIVCNIHIVHMSHDMTKPTKWACTQGRLSYPLCAQWVAKDPSFLHADSEDSYQTGRMPRLIWVFAGHTLILLVLSCCSSHNVWLSLVQSD